MCIVHKGFRGFRAVSPALTLGGNLIGLKPAIPYDTIHSTLCPTGKPNAAKNGLKLSRLDKLNRQVDQRARRFADSRHK